MASNIYITLNTDCFASLTNILPHYLYNITIRTHANKCVTIRVFIYLIRLNHTIIYQRQSSAKNNLYHDMKHEKCHAMCT